MDHFDRSTVVYHLRLAMGDKQIKRMRVYMTSISFFRKKAAVLLCTDIAAQRLDFPVVHWVVQLDCPETFIELVGRTARYEKK